MTPHEAFIAAHDAWLGVKNWLRTHADTPLWGTPEAQFVYGQRLLDEERLWNAVKDAGAALEAAQGEQMQMEF
jgi:hypothetical protein